MCLFLLCAKNQHAWADLLSLSLINQQTEAETDKQEKATCWYEMTLHK